MTLAPTTANLTISQTQQFTPTVSNTTNTAVTWNVTPNLGTISSSGLYTAPGSIASQQPVTVTATSAADTTKSASATVTLNPPGPPVITSLSTTTVAPGGSLTIYGTGFGQSQGTGTVFLGSNYATVTSWSSTQISATVAASSVSGTAQVQQYGTWSNAINLTVTGPNITSVSPTSAAPLGVTVTISGSGFTGTQGQVWLGTAAAVVTSWSDTQIQAQVGAGSLTGNAMVLVAGVMCNGGPFTVTGTPIITSVSPNSGTAGTSVTITGSGFGPPPGTSTLTLGSMPGLISSWTDTQIVATVAMGSLTGIAQVVQSSAKSNAMGFTVPTPGGNSVMPAMVMMAIGDTRTLQAQNSSGQPVTVPTWTSSDPNTVSLSTDNPPLLSALKAGHVTITAGTGSADVTVYDPTTYPNYTLPIGTVLWTNPGDGSGVTSIVPAVPSSSGVADVFAFQADNTVAAVAVDGTTAWTANIGCSLQGAVPNFQGGLIAGGCQPNTLVALDGMTGSSTVLPIPAPNSGGGYWRGSALLVHPDGTVFVAQGNPSTVVGIDPTTGAQKFSIPLEQGSGPYVPGSFVAGGIVAGDGNAYIAYGYEDSGYTSHFMVLRSDTSGNYTNFDIQDFPSSVPGSIMLNLANVLGDSGSSINLITNADQGVYVTWAADAMDHVGVPPPPPPQTGQGRGGASPVRRPLAARDDSGSLVQYGAAMIGAGGVTPVNAPSFPNQDSAVIPVLQQQDGSFIGTYAQGTCPFLLCADQTNMVAFDSSGNVRWTVPNMCPQIATDDGGVIAQAVDENGSCDNPIGLAVAFDQNGNATRQFELLTRSWTANWYRDGDVQSISVTYPGLGPSGVAIDAYFNRAFTFAATRGGNPSGNGADVPPHSAPQEALDILVAANLTGPTACNALFGQFASVAGIPEATLTSEFKATAANARRYVFDGPTSNTVLDAVKFPGAASAGVSTVGEWFAAHDNPPRVAEGFSQFNGSAVWFRLDDWRSWIKGWFSYFLITKTGKVNSYAMGTVMHEILHKQSVGGGFTHNDPPDSRDMAAVIAKVGWPSGMDSDYNPLSQAFGLMCFSNVNQ